MSGTRDGACLACGRGFYLDWGNWAEETDAVRIERKLAEMKNQRRAPHA